MCQGAFSLRCVVGIRESSPGDLFPLYHCGTSTSTFSTLTSVPSRARSVRRPAAPTNSTQAPRHPLLCPNAWTGHPGAWSAAIRLRFAALDGKERNPS